MEKGELVLRVKGNEIVFKFPLLPSPTSKAQDTVCMINHRNYEVSGVQEKLPRKGKERPKKDAKG